MIVKYQKFQIGRHLHTYRFQGKNLLEIERQINYLGIKNVKCCAKCGSDNIDVEYHDPSDYEYVRVVCFDCRAYNNFGQRKDNKDRFFYRDDRWQEYQQQQGGIPSPSAADMPQADTRYHNRFNDFENEKP